MTPGVPAPGFAARMGEVLERRRAVEFRALRTRSLVNRLVGCSMPFGWTANPFRGCEIGCRYCYARPTHQYLGHAEPEAFEQQIYVKQLEGAGLGGVLARARDSGQEIAIGTATDPYQPAESRFGVTRRVLEAAVRVPGLRLGITTKSTLVGRDVDLLRRIAAVSDLRVNVSLISLDARLLRLLEPRAPRPDLRLAAMRALAEAGIRTRLLVMPVLPLLTDGEPGLRALLGAARAAGAEEALCQALFLRSPTVHAAFLRFVRSRFPRALGRYRRLYPEPGDAPRAYRAAVEGLVARLAGAAGFPPASRRPREDAATPRRRQLTLLW